jgi:lipid A ethanolaminephosphotransferase
VGETARAANFRLQGYARQTNPRLAQQLDLYYFSNTMSCGTNTATSLPCMFSRQERTSFKLEDASYQENLLDVLQRAGVEVYWLDNNSGSKDVASRLKHPEESVCSSNACFDEVLLSRAQQLVAQGDDRSKDRLLVMHQLGNHGPLYYKRYPKEFNYFQPICTESALQKCSSESIVNAYDNAIMYTDFVISETIDWLKTYEQQYAVGLLYVSDHGESLGEQGLYLHGTPYWMAPKVQKHVPMLIWVPNLSQRAMHLNDSCLQKQVHRPLSHDHLFDTMLGIFRIHTQEYQSSLDILNECRSTLG